MDINDRGERKDREIEQIFREELRDVRPSEKLKADTLAMMLEKNRELNDQNELVAARGSVIQLRDWFSPARIVAAVAAAVLIAVGIPLLRGGRNMSEVSIPTSTDYALMYRAADGAQLRGKELTGEELAAVPEKLGGMDRESVNAYEVIGGSGAAVDEILIVDYADGRSSLTAVRSRTQPLAPPELFSGQSEQIGSARMFLGRDVQTGRLCAAWSEDESFCYVRAEGMTPRTFRKLLRAFGDKSAQWVAG